LFEYRHRLIDMRVFELNRKQVLAEAAFPVRGIHARIDIEMDFGGLDVPPKAARRLALEAVRKILETATEEDLTALSQPMHRTAAVPEQEAIISFTSEGEEKRVDSWTKPEALDLRVIKSAHRVIQEVSRRGTNGRAVLAADLVGSIGLSAPTLGRLLRKGESANEYLKNYIVVSPHGRTKALDLTPDGRVLASKIRAGVVPS
jgi:hypothetical protein